MRKQIGGGKNAPARGSRKKFSPAHEISRQGPTLLKESVLFQDSSVFSRWDALVGYWYPQPFLQPMMIVCAGKMAH